MGWKWKGSEQELKGNGLKMTGKWAETQRKFAENKRTCHPTKRKMRRQRKEIKETKEHETKKRGNRWRNPWGQKRRRPPLPLENKAYPGNGQNLGWNGLKMKGHITQQKGTIQGRERKMKGEWTTHEKNMQWKREKEIKEHETINHKEHDQRLAPSLKRFGSSPFLIFWAS